jgi:hypothetical protein
MPFESLLIDLDLVTENGKSDDRSGYQIQVESLMRHLFLAETAAGAQSIAANITRIRCFRK